MSAEEHLKAGDISAAYADLTAQIRKSPADAKLRVFLFQMLCVQGEWKRALTQLNVVGEMDPMALPMVQSYREAIACEIFREAVFAGQKAPMVFGAPEQWVALMIQALKPLADGNSEQAADMRAEAFESAPASSGTADGKAFDWIADADMRLGPVCEIIMNGHYYWAPYSTIARLKFDDPVDLRDRVWTPAEITWANGGEVVAFIPTRYPGAPASGEDALMLSAETTWSDAGNETFVGAGQRLLTTDADDLPLMDIREILLDNKVDAPTGDADGAG